MSNARVKTSWMALAVLAGLISIQSANGALYSISNESTSNGGGTLDLGFGEFNHIQMRVDLPGANFDWVWHPAGLVIHRDSSGADVTPVGNWVDTVNKLTDTQGRGYFIQDFSPDGEPQANDYSWGEKMTFAVSSDTVDLAHTLFTVNFNLYRTGGSTSTGGAGPQLLSKNFDLIHYSNNTWSQGTAGDWYEGGNTRPIGPTGEDTGWDVVGGGSWNPGYLTSVPVPEPAMMSLLGLTSLLFVRRRV